MRSRLRVQSNAPPTNVPNKNAEQLTRTMQAVSMSNEAIESQPLADLYHACGIDLAKQNKQTLGQLNRHSHQVMVCELSMSQEDCGYSEIYWRVRKFIETDSSDIKRYDNSIFNLSTPEQFVYFVQYFNVTITSHSGIKIRPHVNFVNKADETRQSLKEFAQAHPPENLPPFAALVYGVIAEYYRLGDMALSFYLASAFKRPSFEVLDAIRRFICDAKLDSDPHTKKLDIKAKRVALRASPLAYACKYFQLKSLLRNTNIDTLYNEPSTLLATINHYDSSDKLILQLLQAWKKKHQDDKYEKALLDQLKTHWKIILEMSTDPTLHEVITDVLTTVLSNHSQTANIIKQLFEFHIHEQLPVDSAMQLFMPLMKHWLTQSKNFVFELAVFLRDTYGYYSVTFSHHCNYLIASCYYHGFGVKKDNMAAKELLKTIDTNVVPEVYVLEAQFILRAQAGYLFSAKSFSVFFQRVYCENPSHHNSICIDILRALQNEVEQNSKDTKYIELINPLIIFLRMLPINDVRPIVDSLCVYLYDFTGIQTEENHTATTLSAMLALGRLYLVAYRWRDSYFMLQTYRENCQPKELAQTNWEYGKAACLFAEQDTSSVKELITIKFGQIEEALGIGYYPAAIQYTNAVMNSGHIIGRNTEEDYQRCVNYLVTCIQKIKERWPSYSGREQAEVCQNALSLLGHLEISEAQTKYQQLSYDDVVQQVLATLNPVYFPEQSVPPSAPPLDPSEVPADVPMYNNGHVSAQMPKPLIPPTNPFADTPTDHAPTSNTPVPKLYPALPNDEAETEGPTEVPHPPVSVSTHALSWLPHLRCPTRTESEGRYTQAQLSKFFTDTSNDQLSQNDFWFNMLRVSVHYAKSLNDWTGTGHGRQLRRGYRKTIWSCLSQDNGQMLLDDYLRNKRVKLDVKLKAIVFLLREKTDDSSNSCKVMRMLEQAQQKLQNLQMRLTLQTLPESQVSSLAECLFVSQTRGNKTADAINSAKTQAIKQLENFLDQELSYIDVIDALSLLNAIPETPLAQENPLQYLRQPDIIETRGWIKSSSKSTQPSSTYSFMVKALRERLIAIVSNEPWVMTSELYPADNVEQLMTFPAGKQNEKELWQIYQNCYEQAQQTCWHGLPTPTE